ncbi:hypothetical protein [Shewanella insulae]|uniref:hypothetical protein n=1 Tax=Shewanella insulae TaxID=2681496 RepID=UPI0024810F04|nr:hypothetical protein [Shewanella insulae]
MRSTLRTLSNYTLLFGSLCLTANSSAEGNNRADDEIARILDKHPNCIETTLAPISLTLTSKKYPAETRPLESEAFKAALTQLTQQATDKGAEVIVLTQVSNHILSKSKAKRLSQRSSQETVKVTQLKTHLEAELYRLCEHDKSLSQQATSYDSNGYEIHQSQFEYTFEPPTPKSAAKLAAAKTLPPAIVSLDEGVYGATLGMKPEELYQLLGPASIELPLTSENFAWGYGRHLWFVFTKEHLAAISTDFGPLNSTGKNLIDYRDGFDDAPWLINGKIAYRTPITQVLHTLGLKQTKKGSNHLQLSDGDRQLVLNFDTFSQSGEAKPESLFTGFSLYQDRKALSVQGKQPSTDTLSPLLKQLTPSYSGERPGLKQIQKTYPTMAKLAISGDGEWWLLGNHLQLKFDDDTLHKVRVASGIYQQASDAALTELWDKMAIPSQKDKLLAQFQQANDEFDSVDIYEESYSLVAKYDSYDDDAALYELEITYF